MTKLHKLLVSIGHFITSIVHNLPDEIKKYGPEILHVGNAFKAFLVSPLGLTAETIAAQIFGGPIVGASVAVIQAALNKAIPGITGVIAHADLPTAQQAEEFIKYLQTLSPQMQHAGILKLASGIIQHIDPAMTEVDADTAAQMLYNKSLQATITP